MIPRAAKLLVDGHAYAHFFTPPKAFYYQKPFDTALNEWGRREPPTDVDI